MQLPGITRRHLVLLIATGVLLAACGGGGSSAPDQGQPAPPPDPAAFAQQTLQECLSPHVRSLLALLGDLQVLLEGDPGGVQPTITLDGVNLIQNSVTVSVDLDLDTNDDLGASVRLATPGGQPVMSATEFANLALGLSGADLSGFFASLPDGTHVIANITRYAAPVATGVLDLVLAGGTFSQGSGQISVQADGCTTVFSFTDVPASAVLSGGLYPDMEVDFTLTSLGERLTGTLDLDGTSVAAVRALFYGVSYDFLLDLETGVLTPVP